MWFHFLAIYLATAYLFTLFSILGLYFVEHLEIQPWEFSTYSFVSGAVSIAVSKFLGRQFDIGELRL